MDKERIRYLLLQYAKNEASKEEVRELFGLLKSAKSNKVLKDIILNVNDDNLEGLHLPKKNWDETWSAIKSSTIESSKTKISSIIWIRAAAAILLLAVGSGTYLFFSRHHKKNGEPSASVEPIHYKIDIAPGSDKATLQKADGSMVMLDSAKNGFLTTQGNTKIIKLKAGVIAYDVASASPKSVLHNTISTPRAGQYQVILPDGSKVWLNAASSLSFPVAFTGKERTVTLKGEAYFEIEPLTSSHTGKKLPFHVKVIDQLQGDDMDVEVLGTHFNIMAYNNEQSMKTTLLQGKVKVTRHGITKILVPGQEAIMENRVPDIKVNDTNTEQTVAWKNGLFRFKETGIRESMRWVERWYNVDIEYRTRRTDQDYTGVVPRTKNVSALLQTLELTGTVHFQIEESNTGRAGKIIVLP